MIDQRMFPPDLAERCKASVGQKYQPSNGTEGAIFQELFCMRCVRCKQGDESCDIATRAWWLDLSDPNYPSEWQYGPDGQPKCTAFEAIKKEQEG